MSSANSEVATVTRPDASKEGGQRALIRVVERNPAVQRLEKFFLEQAGYGVEFSSDGVSALARARELRPQILVTEIMAAEGVTCLMMYELTNLLRFMASAIKRSRT
jgi:CheY-like chemotaxis protein